MTSQNDFALRDLGERGFLKRFLPRLSHFGRSAFLVPPGDDAAVLTTAPRLSLSIDGLTEGTHFRSSWALLFEKITGVKFGRALGWKLLGSALSDLAAMGGATRRWAMIFLGAPGSTKVRFLMDFYQGLTDMARRYNCALAGGDTVRAKELSMAAAVGGDLTPKKPMTRGGAKPGDLVCLAGTVGDASIGLKLLEGKVKMPTREAAYFMRRLFEVVPLFNEAEKLHKLGCVTSMLDLSDSLGESVQLVCEASKVGAAIDTALIPISKPYARFYSRTSALLTGGEDYALLFTIPHSAHKPISNNRNFAFTVIGEIKPAAHRIKYFNQGRPIPIPKYFQQYRAT